MPLKNSRITAIGCHTTQTTDVFAASLATLALPMAFLIDNVRKGERMALDLIKRFPDPSVRVEGQNATAGFLVASWAYAEVATLDEAKEVREYLAKWPEGPQFDMLTLDRVAAIHNVTSQAVLYNIKAQKLRAVWAGRAWLVPFGEVSAWKPAPQGRPKKENS